MSYAAFGYGRGSTNVASAVAYGFGILRLFPETIITVLNTIIYEEIRNLVVDAEARTYQVQPVARSMSIEDDRVVSIQPQARERIIPETIREATIYEQPRVIDIQPQPELIINEETRVATVTADDRTYVVSAETRST